MFPLVSIYVKTKLFRIRSDEFQQLFEIESAERRESSILVFPLLIRLELSSPYNFIDCSLLFFDTV